MVYSPAMLTKLALPACCLWAALTVPLAPAQDVYREIVVGEGEREPAPHFHAKTLTGEQFNNESTKGKVVLFQFWTTWCPYCKSEEPLVNDLTAEFADKGLVVIAVDVGESKKSRATVFERASSQVSHRDDRRYQSGRDVPGELDILSMSSSIAMARSSIRNTERPVRERLRRTLARAGIDLKNQSNSLGPPRVLSP